MSLDESPASNDQMTYTELVERLRTLKKDVELLRWCLEEKETELRGVEEKLRVHAEEAGASARMKPGSKRSLAMLREAERKSKKSKYQRTVVDFARQHRRREGGVDPALVCEAFRACGNGVDILRALKRSWQDDPAVRFYWDVDGCIQPSVWQQGAAIQDAHVLLRMGLVTADAVGEVFGGRLDLDEVPLPELREMTRNVGKQLSSMVDGKRHRLSRDELIVRCAPLRMFSLDAYTNWKRYMANRDRVNFNMGKSRIWHEMSRMVAIPGREADLALNELMCREYPQINQKILRMFEMDWLPRRHPARYRWSLFRAVVTACRSRLTALKRAVAHQREGTEDTEDGTSIDETLARDPRLLEQVRRLELSESSAKVRVLRETTTDFSTAKSNV